MPPRVTETTQTAQAWESGDPSDGRRFLRAFDEGEFVTESGIALGPVDVAFETWGRLDPSGGNAVLVLHALTGDSHAAAGEGEQDRTAGWWEGLIGPGSAIDTNRWFVVCPNVLGGCRGTTGPSSIAPDGRPYGSRFPSITVRDQVAVERRFAQAMGIDTWAAVIGGSMGGMRALEWAVSHPSRLEHAVFLAVGAASSAEQIALCTLQSRAIRLDPNFAGGDYYGLSEGPWEGMAIARGIGQLSYRSAEEMERRFGRSNQAGEDPMAGGRYAIESYLHHHGTKLARRFDPNSYIGLSTAMNHHDVGRGRGGIRAALSTVEAETTVVGISSDRLYPLVQQHQLAALLPGGRPARVIESEVGHDGFLVELDRVGSVISEALAGH